MKNILVAVDLKSSDSALLKQASFFADKFGGKTWIVHVTAPDPEFLGYGMGPKYIRDFRADELRSEHRQLQSYADELENNSLSAEGLLIQGSTEEMLEMEIKKLHIDMLIIGNRKHSFLYDMFVGHTANRVIRDISIPVLIVPLPEEK